jgi:hypothetical protein
MKSNQEDYMKYWRVIRQFAKVKYELTQSDLDMLFFLYSEKYFDRAKFAEFDTLLDWDINRFESLRKRGWIEVFKMGTRKATYKLSIKATRVIQSLYRKLSGEEIPTSNSFNRMFLKNVSYTDRVYRDMIIKMNEAIKQRRHQSPE